MTRNFGHRPLLVITALFTLSSCGVERKMDKTNEKMDITVEQMRKLEAVTSDKMDLTLEAMEKLLQTTTNGMKDTLAAMAKLQVTTSEGMEKTITEMKGMSKTTQDMAVTTKEMSATTKDMSSTTKEMATTTKEMATTTNGVLDEIKKTNTTTGEVFSALSTMLNKMTDLEKKLTIATAVEQIIADNKCHYLEDQLPLAEAIAMNADAEKFTKLNSLWISALKKEPASNAKPEEVKHEKLCRFQALIAINGLADQSMIDSVIQKHIIEHGMSEEVAKHMLMFRSVFLNKQLEKHLGALAKAPSFARLTEAARTTQLLDKIATQPFVAEIQASIPVLGMELKFSVAPVQKAWVELEKIVKGGVIQPANAEEEKYLKDFAANLDEKLKLWTSAEAPQDAASETETTPPENAPAAGAAVPAPVAPVPPLAEPTPAEPTPAEPAAPVAANPAPAKPQEAAAPSNPTPVTSPETNETRGPAPVSVTPPPAAATATTNNDSTPAPQAAASSSAASPATAPGTSAAAATGSTDNTAVEDDNEENVEQD